MGIINQRITGGYPLLLVLLVPIKVKIPGQHDFPPGDIFPMLAAEGPLMRQLRGRPHVVTEAWTDGECIRDFAQGTHPFQRSELFEFGQRDLM